MQHKNVLNINRLHSNKLKIGKDSSQRTKKQFCPVSILYICRMYNHRDDQSNSVNENMSFSTIDFFPRIISSFTGCFRSFYRLTVNNTSAGLSIPTFLNPNEKYQCLMDILPYPCFLPFVEMVIYCLPRRKIMRQ